MVAQPGWNGKKVKPPAFLGLLFWPLVSCKSFSSIIFLFPQEILGLTWVDKTMIVLWHRSAIDS
jgi:hypothetical protein